MHNLLRDARYGLRMLVKNPGFTVVAVLTLALGIGANTAIFSVVNRVLLQPLSYPDPDRLVLLEISSPQGSGPGCSIPIFNAWREQTSVFSAVAAYDPGGPGVNLTGGDRPLQLKGIRASAGYFGVFGVPMAMGRPYTVEEDRPHGPKLAVISYGLWQRQFGADPGIIGRPIELGGEPYVVTGVVGRNFHTESQTDVWLPLQADPNSTDQAFYLFAAARLKPGVTMEQAKAQLAGAAQAFEARFPGQLGKGGSFTAVPLRDEMVAGVRTALLVLLGAVGFVLLIACANVANLLLARATGRRREIALRAALGAGRGRVISQLLTESVLLSLLGGLVGLVVGLIGVRLLLQMNPGDIPRIGPLGGEVGFDWRVLLFVLAASLATGVLFGLIPALNSSRPDLADTLKESGSRSGTGFRQNKARAVLVVSEMALALVLLVGAALLIRTFMSLRSVQPGFDRHNVLTMEMSLTGSHFDTTAAVATLVREAEQRVEAIPGVEALATTCSLPLEPSFGLPFTIEGRPLPPGKRSHGGGNWRTVSTNYFEVFKIALLRGRLFTQRDDGGAQGVVIINKTMADKFWPNADPVGQLLSIGKGVGPEFAEPPRLIVGVVADVKDTGLNRDPGNIMYIPVSQMKDGVTALNNRIIPLTFAIRTHVEPFSVREAVERELRSASGGLPVAHVRSMEQVVSESTARSDFNTMLLTVFAAVALLLAAIGIYGVMAYSVQQRRQEIGVRMALGAAPGAVSRMVVGEGMRLALIGVVLGVAGALALTRAISGFLYGVKAWDPVAFSSVSALLAIVALAATYLPARRATLVDPVIALRNE
ncbi:MAG TPA: ABC transporter permease [Terriglobales bacterium]|nr:ABC transporter permease [Terriglobales bacterium]